MDVLRNNRVVSIRVAIAVACCLAIIACFAIASQSAHAASANSGAASFGQGQQQGSDGYCDPTSDWAMYDPDCSGDGSDPGDDNPYGPTGETGPTGPPPASWPPTPTGQVAHLATDGRTAIAPNSAPRVVKLAVHAANRLDKLPYRWGGGHAKLHDSGYDCSGSVSYVLRSAGLVTGSMVSGQYKSWGAAGSGRWISVYANSGHVFMVIAGLRFDTSGQGESGPRWRDEVRDTDGFKIRHPLHF